MEDAEICDMELDSIAIVGAKRYINMRKKGTSALLPPPRDIDADTLLMERQAEEMTPSQLATYNIELLRRIEGFLFLFDSNVGGSEDFPLQLIAENQKTMSLFKEELGKVRNAVGCLTEV